MINLLSLAMHFSCGLAAQNVQTNLPDVRLTGVMVSGAMTTPVGAKRLTKHDQAITDNLNQVLSQHGQIQTITLDSRPGSPPIEASPGYELQLSWGGTDHNPTEIYVKIALDEAAFGPEGSTAVVTLPAQRKMPPSVVSATVSPITRTGADMKYVKAYQRMFKLRAGGPSHGICRASLNLELGTLRASDGGKIRVRFTVLSVSDTAPPGVP